MIFFKKSEIGDTCLDDEKEKVSGTYNCGKVLETLKNDFKNKCYICEIKGSTSINIEHFRPHKNDVEKKFDWNNLYFSCSHCNNIKLGQYENIIDCCKEDENIGQRLDYEFIPFPMEDVKVTPKDDLPETIETALLLNNVYSGTTIHKKMESVNLRNLILDDVIDFQKNLNEFYKIEDDEEYKETVKRKIINHLKKSSSFTAIKRSRIMKNEKLKEEFEQYFD